MTTRPATAWLRALRPAQWMKNGVVAAAYFFAWGDSSQRAHVRGVEPLLLELLAVVCFCCVSSGVYLVNDVRDVEADRAHPVKRLRPLAAGLIGPRAALAVAGLLAAVGLCGAALSGW